MVSNGMFLEVKKLSIFNRYLWLQNYDHIQKLEVIVIF